MPARRRIDPAAGAAALTVCRAAGFEAAPRAALATAVRWSLEELALAAPGRAVEVRVPPYAAVQCLPGPVHRRGTPPSVVETEPAVWLRLAVGELGWQQALDAGLVRASGQRTDLAGWLPLVRE